MAHRCRHAGLALTMALLGVASARPVGRPVPPPCPVVLEIHDYFFVGRKITVRLNPDCARFGSAQVRFRSRFGTQPDGSPGYFPISGSQQLTRAVPYSWWVEQRDRLGIFQKVVW